MNILANYLFVYGTLQPTFNNPFAYYLQQFSRYVGKATTTGRLFDIGQYPGAFYEANGSTSIHGTVVELVSQQIAILTYLDEYEGINNEVSQPSEYRRIVVPSMVDGQILHCWMYVYNWPVDNRIWIKSGDYYQYLTRSGLVE